MHANEPEMAKKWEKKKKSVDESRPKYGKLKLTKEKPKKITQRIWSAPKRIMSKRAWLRMPDMNKKRRDGVDYVATSIGPNRTQVYLPVIFESLNELTYAGDIRHEKGTGIRKADKVAYDKIFDKIWKKFGNLGGGFIEFAGEEMGIGKSYVIKWQVARISKKRGKFRDWLFTWVEPNGNITAKPKGGKSLGVIGNIKNPNKVAQALKDWSDEDLHFESVNEDLYYGYYKNKEVKVNAKSDKDAKKQIISKLKIPKGDLNRASMINHTKNQFKLESVNEKVTYHDGGRTVGIDVRDIYDYMVSIKKTNPAKFKKDMKHKVLKGIWDRYSKGGEMYREAKDRDYKAEYKKFQSSTKAKKYRAELNKYNRQKGTYGNGDGKDASHKGGKIVGFEAQSKNRGRAEKSRLKKESINESVKVRNGETPMEGKWNIYDNSTGKAIKEVGNARAATRLMNRLMSSGQYKEVAAKWIGEPVNEANIKDIEQIVKKKQSKKIGGVLVDMQTANAIMTVWKALSTSNKKKFEKLPIKKMAKISWKLVK